jgi:hypothetical protein
MPVGTLDGHRKGVPHNLDALVGESRDVEVERICVVIEIRRAKRAWQGRRDDEQAKTRESWESLWASARASVVLPVPGFPVRRRVRAAVRKTARSASTLQTKASDRRRTAASTTDDGASSPAFILVTAGREEEARLEDKAVDEELLGLGERDLNSGQRLVT